MKNNVTLKRSKSGMGSFRKSQLRFIWLWLIIPIISWLVFFLYVNVSSFVQAFQDRFTRAFTFDNFVIFWNSLTGHEMTQGGAINVAIKNTAKFFLLGLCVNFPLTLAISYFLFKRVYGYKVFRIILYFPVIISNVAMTGVFKEFIATTGPLGTICKGLGITLPTSGLLGTSETAVGTVMFFSVWTAPGLYMLLFCGAMARIPLEVLESGRLDGVSAGREFFSLILPLIWPTLSTTLVLQFTGILSASGEIMLLIGDNQSFTLGAHTLSHWIFSMVYSGGNHMQGQYSLVSAAGLSLTLMTLPFILFVRWLFLEKIPSVEY